ncbi:MULTISPECIES: GNAT family N-acetyltransferase [Bacillaceae]|uniref:GNAT family N-acetyltransferase n=1 Tax=Evansella alkalicola TaxID=745819 RepID=A0ABS6JVL6_9BACI|nr:GNAT family N-acetyltransferase [Litchfieldia alkalitelluris]MBU9721287.1 GNAT family N-acetyltransferase [Bacillus alkalicola]
MSLVVNKELAFKLEESEINTLMSRLTLIQSMDENPMGVDIKKFGNATAFSIKNIPGPSFNTVKGLQEGDEAQIERIIEFYKSKDIPVRFEISPAHTSPKLLASLMEAGFYHHDFHSTLYAYISTYNETSNESHGDITIRKLESHEFDIFADIYTKGFQMPEFLRDGVAQNNAVLFKKKNWTFYIAFYNDVPAGVGVIYIQDRVATLSASTTIPEYRNRGIHSTLIKRRINKALLEKCDLIVGQAKFGSVSQNNMERAGLGLAYTKAIWIPQ